MAQILESVPEEYFREAITTVVDNTHDGAAADTAGYPPPPAATAAAATATVAPADGPNLVGFAGKVIALALLALAVWLLRRRRPQRRAAR